MQDNEFDNLFRSKLDGFETEPSVNVWQNIDAGLHTGNRRKLLAPLLSAAASIFILIAAGVLLITHYEKSSDVHPSKGDIAKNDVRVKTTALAQAKTSAEVASIRTPAKANPVKHIIALQRIKKQIITTQPVTPYKDADLRAATKQPEPEVIAAEQQKPDIITQPKQDGITLAANNISAPAIKPIQAVLPDKPVGDESTQSAKRHHIHSLGDMLNTVIAAVDKRKDKLLEFTDTDDDESVITGVNLGIVTVKKQN